MEDSVDLNDWYSIAAARRAPALMLVVALQACGPAPSQTTSRKTTGASSALTDSPGDNGLHARALLHSTITTNPKALRALASHALDDALFDEHKHPYMSLQLTADRAQAVMKYIVSCALDQSQQVRYVDPITHAVHVWPGEMGLCQSWGTSKPTKECLQLVSSCLFARTNRLDSRVPALFGNPQLRLPRAQVGITTWYPKGDGHVGWAMGKAIPAFSKGWKPGDVGRCTPNTPIALSIPAPSRCAQASLRVCKGIQGCDRDDAGFLGEKQGPCADTPLAFTCPAEGFYGVMTSPTKLGVAQRASDAGIYPALEKDVFPFLEGAFFGDLFDPDALTWSREMVLEHGKPKENVSRRPGSREDDDEDTVPHRNIYACYSLANDEEGVAYLNARICAKTGPKRCFPNTPKRCSFRDPKVNEEKGYHCHWKSRDGLYQDCRGEDGVTYPVMTVHLNAPCGLTDSGCAVKLPTETAD
jgi:hypothetical protein